MKKAPYTIMAPPYRNSSAGIRALYELRRHLEERGYEAKIFQGGIAPSDAIVVYPEVVPGNPLNGKTVARLVLNYPGLLGGDKEYDSREIVFAYWPAYYPGAPVLTIPVIEDFFRDEGLPRSGGCFWVGKGEGKVEEIPETKGLIDITYDWPDNRRQLAALLNQTATFYTYDNCTALITEAERCGCRVIIIPGDVPRIDYDESIKDFDAQLNEFIRITQAAAGKELKISFGVNTNDRMRLDMVLRQSEISGKMHFVENPESATKGLNKLLGIIEAEGADVAVLTHHDMYFRRGWLPQVREQIAKLPENWICAGIIGKDMQGRICGQYHDMRVPQDFNTKHIHDFPQPACCFDECCIIVNLKKGFRFDETMDGFDLYGTLAVLQTWEMGGTAWILDAYAEHYTMRPFTWAPDDGFCNNYKWLFDRFKEFERVDSTALGLPEGQVTRELRFETSTA